MRLQKQQLPAEKTLMKQQLPEEKTLMDGKHLWSTMQNS